ECNYRPNADPTDQLPDQSLADSEESADTEDCHFLLFPNVFVFPQRFGRSESARRYRVKVVLYQLSYVPKGLNTRSRIVYFGETAKVTNGRSSVKRVISASS